MIKSDLVLKIAERNPHLYQRDVENIVNAILDTIADALARGDRVELRGFGAFSVKRRDARTARNPRRPLAFNPLGVVSRKREGADLVAGFVLDADLPLAVAPELAAEVSQHRDTRGEWTGGRVAASPVARVTGT